MNRKTRLIILLFCVACFFTIAPVLVAYSMGYRFDFENMEIVGTGGIYVRTFPTAEQIIIDSNLLAKPGIFSNAVFTQSLLPKDHTVIVKKDGYYDYFKTLPVQEREVTKLENVILFKKSLDFDVLFKEVDYFSVAPNNQNMLTASSRAKTITFTYFNLNNNNPPKIISVAKTGEVLDIKWSDNSNKALIKIQLSSEIFYELFDTSLQEPKITQLPYLDKNSQKISFNPADSQEIFYEENNTLYSLKNNKAKTIMRKLIAYHFSGDNIAWLSFEGTLQLSNVSGKLINNLSEEKFNISSGKNYEMLLIAEKTFLRENNLLFLFNPETKMFESFYAPEANYETLASPDNKNFIYCTDDKIHIYSFPDKKYKEIFLGGEVVNCQWLNNDYIIFTSKNEIVISEIDSRGNINTARFPFSSTLNKIFYVPQTGKIYILTDGNLVVSEKITP